MILIALAAAIIAICLGYQLGASPLVDPDEGRNAEVAREMNRSGDFVLPTLNGMPYLDKPILYFATDAISLRLFGNSAGAARLPSLLFTLATIALVGWFGSRIQGAETAWAGAAATAASPMVVSFARTVIFDSALSFFICLSLVSFFMAIESPADRRFWSVPHRWTLLAWASIGLGILTKGPVALVVPLLVAGIHAAIRRRSRAVWSASGVAAMLVIVLPWVRAMSVRIPGFLSYVFLTETLERITTNNLHRSAPFWFFVPLLIAGSLPWSIALLRDAREVWRARAGHPEVLYLILWIAAPLLFFSLSTSKRPQYILPVIPAVALLFAHRWAAGKMSSGTRVAGVVVAAIGGLFLLLTHIPAAARAIPPRMAGAVAISSLMTGLSFLIAGLLAVIFARDRRSIVALMAPILLLSVTTEPALRMVNTKRSSASLARILRPRMGHGEMLIGVKTYRPSLSFYLQQPIVIVTTDGGELTSNYVALHPEIWTGSKSDMMKPLSWVMRSPARCNDVYLIEDDKADMRRHLVARIPFLADADGISAFSCPSPKGAAGTGESGKL